MTIGGRREMSGRNAYFLFFKSKKFKVKITKKISFKNSFSAFN